MKIEEDGFGKCCKTDLAGLAQGFNAGNAGKGEIQDDL